MTTEKFKLGFAHVGSNIHYAGLSFGSSVKNKFTGKNDVSVDDDLIAAFEHDVKQIITAMKFLEKQSRHMALKFWPYFFKNATNSAISLQQLVGEDSLTFDDIQMYYDEFDRLQLTSETVLVHPKERQIVIPSIQYEISNYLVTIDQLQTKVVHLAESNAKYLKSRIEALITHLKHVLKVIKARKSHRAKCDKLEWKTDRLTKKKTPLTDAEQRDLSRLETQLSSAKALHDNISDRLKKVIPECLLLVEEFVESLTKWIICNQSKIYQEIERTIRYFAVFHGYADSEKDEAGKSYERIIDEWETSNTALRLQIESFLKTIYDKNPQLLDEEVDNNDKTLKISKAWTLMAQKVTEKLHKVKPQDTQNGIFTNHTMADPLRSFTNYCDVSMNVSETYHPQRVLEYSEVHPTMPHIRTPPPLPPRNDSRSIPLPLNSPAGSITPVIGLGAFADVDAINSDSEISLLSSSDSESEGTTVSEVSSILLADDVTPDKAERQIIKLYNFSKNEITEAPLDISLWVNLDKYSNHNDVFDNKNTISYKLHELNRFFQKALDHAKESSDGQERKIVVAKRDFRGVQPGDLSFSVGDKVEVVFDLQSVSATYNNDGKNWFVGTTGDVPHRRIGFAPNTYF
ncbi:CIC11C00000003750 [Sungouiella intermedia]|uniref:CIC11C00000003750 n=1 Tax=Sungouiella intermedia TaxID=45354 RepID=A0A1L0D5G0_9ASCO|nr:CIC11C00000003750 [[Candida] intermedia]